MNNFKQRATIAAAVELGCLSPEDAAVLRAQLALAKTLLSPKEVKGIELGAVDMTTAPDLEGWTLDPRNLGYLDGVSWMHGIMMHFINRKQAKIVTRAVEALTGMDLEAIDGCLAWLSEHEQTIDVGAAHVESAAGLLTKVLTQLRAKVETK